MKSIKNVDVIYNKYNPLAIFFGRWVDGSNVYNHEITAQIFDGNSNFTVAVVDNVTVAIRGRHEFSKHIDFPNCLR